MRYASPPESYGALWQAQWKITCATVAKIVLCFTFLPFPYFPLFLVVLSVRLGHFVVRALINTHQFITHYILYCSPHHCPAELVFTMHLHAHFGIFFGLCCRPFVWINSGFFFLPHTFCQIHLPHASESELWTNTICFAPNSSLVIFISRTIEFIRTNIKQISHLASTRIGLNGRQSHKQEQFEGEGDGICEYCVGQENEKDQFEWGAKLVQNAQCASEAARRVWLARKVNYINLEVLNWFQQWKIVIDSDHVMQRMNL